MARAQTHHVEGACAQRRREDHQGEESPLRTLSCKKATMRLSKRTMMQLA